MNQARSGQPTRSMRLAQRQHGITLIEMVMVMVLMGALSVIVLVAMKIPIEMYLAGGRRADLSDAADTALRRITRDLHKALPNSVRLVAGDAQCLEFIPTRIGGRYRQALSSSAAAGQSNLNTLDFDSIDTSFDMLGGNPALPADQQIRAGDLVAVNNLGSPGADAYSLDNIALISQDPQAIASQLLEGVRYGSETRIQISGRSTPFPQPSGSHRFQVIPGDEQVISYVCAGSGRDANGDGRGKLYRIAKPALSNPQGLTAYPPPVNCAALLTGLDASASKAAVLATNVSACRFDYDSASSRLGLVRLDLSLSRKGETVRLNSQAGVENLP